MPIIIAKKAAIWMGVSHVIFPQISNKMANPVPRKGIYDIRWNVLQEYFLLFLKIY